MKDVVAHNRELKEDSKETLQRQIGYELQCLGTALGRRLSAKYRAMIFNALQSDEGHAVLDIVPPSRSNNWPQQEKDRLLGLFLSDVEQHCFFVEPIQTTFQQVAMSKVEDSIKDKGGLASSFFKEIYGSDKSNALFAGHVVQKILLLETKAGIKIEIANKDDAGRFKNGAEVFIPQRQTVAKKQKLVSERFVDCLPHLVSQQTLLY